MPIYTTDEMSIEEFTEMVRQHPVEFEPLPARFREDERWLFKHVAEAMDQARHIVGDGEPLVTFFLESKPYVY
jgi:hypothetical protein